MTPGSTNVSATVALSRRSSVTATANVVVVPVPIASLTITPASLSLNLGQGATLTAVARDANGNVLSGRVTTWSSSNPSIATVSQVGLVTTLAAGAVVITATSESKNASSTITITDPLSASGWVFWPANGHFYKFIPGAVTWSAARDLSASANIAGYTGQLASLETTGEPGFITSYLTSLNAQVQGRPYIWFGVYQDLSSPFYSEPSGGWMWLSGASFDMALFGDGEPNNAPTLGPEHVGAMNWYFGSPWYNGTFVDFPGDAASYVLGYVVELTATPSVVPN